MRSANLLPDRRAIGSAFRIRIVVLSMGVPMFLLVNLIGLLVGSALLSADLGSAHSEIASIRENIERVNAELARMSGELLELRSERAVREANAARPVWAGLLRRIAVVMSRHGRLDRFAVRPLGREPGRVGGGTADPLVGFEIGISGLAVHASGLTELLLELEEIGVFDEVTLISSSRVREDAGDASVRFEIRCRITGGGA